jgi:hypothetical protein
MKQEVLKLFKNGHTQRQIHAKTKVPASTISRWLKTHTSYNDVLRLKPKNVDLKEKLEARIITEPNSGCWIWLGNVKKNGYGSFTFKDKNHYAHRLFYQLYVGNINNGFVLDHKCKTKCCCNPNHLEAVTQSENVKRGNRWSKGKR